MRVLIATDGSDCAIKATRALKAFPFPVRSVALVVAVAPALRRTEGSRIGAELRHQLQDAAKTAAEDVRELVAGRFASTGLRIEKGDPRSAILEAATAWNADLIVVGARGLGAVGSFLLGSVSLDVTRHARCPVLVVKDEPTRFRKIVIGIDGSAPALAACRLISKLALESTAVVRLVAVVDPPVFVASTPDLLDGAVGSGLGALSQDIRAAMEKALEDAKAELRDSPARIETALIDGRAASAIAAECTKSDADLLVVGARGLGGFERVLLGSVSENLLRNAPCSVLVVHDRQ